MLLTLTTQTLEIKLAGAVATTELPVVLAYIDGEASNFFPTLQHSISNGTTEVTILDAPESRGKRLVKFMYIRNVDTATVTVTLQLADGATNREIVKIVLLQDETLSYTDTTGFKIIDTNGNTKVGGGGGFAAPTGAVDIGDSATEGSLGSHSRADHQHAHAAPGAGYPQDVAAAEVDGSATTPARSDHVHKNMDIGAKAHEVGGAQTITTSTWTALTFDTDTWDTDNIHDTSSNTERLTATTAGKYLIVGAASFAADATNNLRAISVRQDGTTFLTQNFYSPIQGGSFDTKMNVTLIVDLAATEYVELMVFHDKGSDLDTLGGHTFAMLKIG
ncbi:hypothetical protein LCGC14_2113900 [marine sediment metagenome]|uniref:Uncharacterized protein n=1 Tax=marine sediment metagenome TaxID=412755 RepID=A0A0F9E6C9_9ZZZZ